MTSPTSSLTPRTAYLLHFGLVMSLAAITGVFWVVRDLVTVDVPPVAHSLFRYAAVGELMVAGFVVGRIRSRMQLQQPDEDAALWWSTHGARVVVTWALAHGAAITGAVFWLISGDNLILAAVVISALVILLRLGPGHWKAEPEHRSQLVP